jgi:hypothetical protein
VEKEALDQHARLIPKQCTENGMSRITEAKAEKEEVGVQARCRQERPRVVMLAERKRTRPKPFFQPHQITEHKSRTEATRINLYLVFPAPDPLIA